METNLILDHTHLSLWYILNDVGWVILLNHTVCRDESNPIWSLRSRTKLKTAKQFKRKGDKQKPQSSQQALLFKRLHETDTANIMSSVLNLKTCVTTMCWKLFPKIESRESKRKFHHVLLKDLFSLNGNELQTVYSNREKMKSLFETTATWLTSSNVCSLQGSSIYHKFTKKCRFKAYHQYTTQKRKF